MERINEDRLRAARLWRNPGIRRLAVLCLLALLAAPILSWAFVAFETSRLKQDWLDRDAALIGQLASAHPELAAELPYLFASGDRKPDPETVRQGKELAAKYGMDATLDSSLLPVVSAFRSHAAMLLAGGAALGLAAFSVLIFREFNKPLRDIRRLAASLEKAVKNNERMDYRIYGEGDLGLLAHGVQELSLRLQETIAQLHRDKEFLKETIADISHQLKTPLASLAIYIELLQDKRTKPADAREFLETCRRELERMEWLTLTLLKIARLEAEALELQPVVSPLADTVEQAVEPVRKLAEQKGVRILFEERERIEFLHDPRWLAEAIGNLVKNAVEHSPPGAAVTIRSEQTPVFVRLTVRDEGAGIAERDLPHIFKKFYRASSGGGGVGLGLPLAKSIVERHDGVLSAVRNDTGGTTFTVAIPYRHLTNL
ncbi:sensor histidine kinase [Cohnella thermotolerans]|uniref:sensor histidine kinase n=1 Tax=Cohnella thermotolerans TaxID=329858 RepID=UPI00041F90FC|nr:HAMP domain-containing sensor histidine kinase [Cohnella thermotolerans]